MHNIPFKITVITIVYNGVNEIESTILSVINQTYDNIEYIIVDGGSNDGTVKIIEKYTDKIDVFITEKDKGLYDAMNKGIKASTGSWLNFMNAGDTFYSNSVLLDFFSLDIKYDKYPLLYGYKFQHGKKVMPLPIKSLRKGIIMANHQSMFFNKTILKEDLAYSLKYSIYGDYELVNRIYLKYGEEKIKFVNSPVAIFAGGGISSIVSFQKRKDKFRVLFRHYGIISVFYSLATRFLFKKF